MPKVGEKRYHCMVKAKRREIGMSQARLAREVGISRQALHAIETMKSEPGICTAILIARALHHFAFVERPWSERKRFNLKITDLWFYW